MCYEQHIFVFSISILYLKMPPRRVELAPFLFLPLQPGDEIEFYLSLNTFATVRRSNKTTAHGKYVPFIVEDHLRACDTVLKPKDWIMDSTGELKLLDKQTKLLVGVHGTFKVISPHIPQKVPQFTVSYLVIKIETQPTQTMQENWGFYMLLRTL